MNEVLDYIIRGIADETGHPVDIVFRVWQEQGCSYDPTVTALHDMTSVTARIHIGSRPEQDDIEWHT